MSELSAWHDPAACPRERPPLDRMQERTRDLHAAIDRHARASGTPWLHPERPTVQRDLLGSPAVCAWQEEKAARLLEEQGAWSELPHLYARYGTGGGARLIAALRQLEGARAALVTDSGMQAFSILVDALLGRGAHAVCMRQVYNKSRSLLSWNADRLGGSLTLVDDGDLEALARALSPETRLVLAETYTNPLLRAQDLPPLAALVARHSPRAVLVIDTTIATPWGLRAPALSRGAHVVIGSLTKAIGGQDTALGGYVATNDIALANQLMDLLAMRGGVLDEGRATAIADGLAEAEARHARRCASAAEIARFLSRHPRVERVYSPALTDHPDAAVIARDHVRTSSLVSFRVRDADDSEHRHVADVLASCVIVRYALSFDGLCTKVNHHRTVSEYFTPPEQLRRDGLDRLIRLGVGLEDPGDLIASLNWTLHHGRSVTQAELDGWRASRAAALALR
jgi:cystathionine gamma-lyase